MAHNCVVPELCYECNPLPEPEDTESEQPTGNQQPTSWYDLPLAKWAWEGDAADLER